MSRGHGCRGGFRTRDHLKLQTHLFMNILDSTSGKAASVLLSSVLALSLLHSAYGFCAHCDPDDPIGPGPTDDVLFENRLYIAEGQGRLNEAIKDYDGWDLGVRFAQFILWVAETTGPNPPSADQSSSGISGDAGEDEPGNQEPGVDAGEHDGATSALVLHPLADGLGDHRVVIPLASDRSIENGQRAYLLALLENGKEQRTPMTVSLPLARNVHFGGYAVIVPDAEVGQESDENPLVIGIPFIDGAISTELPPVGISSDSLSPEGAVAYWYELRSELTDSLE